MNELVSRATNTIRRLDDEMVVQEIVTKIEPKLAAFVGCNGAIERYDLFLGLWEVMKTYYSNYGSSFDKNFVVALQSLGYGMTSFSTLANETIHGCFAHYKSRLMTRPTPDEFDAHPHALRLLKMVKAVEKLQNIMSRQSSALHPLKLGELERNQIDSWNVLMAKHLGVELDVNDYIWPWNIREVGVNTIHLYVCEALRSGDLTYVNMARILLLDRDLFPELRDQLGLKEAELRYGGQGEE